ncbi:IclR family transcriptional regulator [Cupriavidus numazuensis]|uniref:Transcriptional regulator KdgR n=1 Tax=Cupriavidus numazuensis TaxID=221992 RepID=A0ABM8TNE4_9BURK|nr:IclR family transcriptional regulator [Cupriavidus numazuensis]CAG2155978.1 Transcriptional regulator KdgR [Cupriavidus numazuensis]
MDDNDRYRAPALDKGLDILELLAEYPDGLTRAEIVKALGRGQSEIYRMLERLVARQYVTRSVGGDRHALSLKLFALAHRHPPVNRLVTQALPVMDVYARQAEQSCHLGMYDRGNVLIVAQVPGPGEWGLSIRLGARVGLVDTGSGHVLLACQTEERRTQMLDEHVAVVGEVKIPEDEFAQTLASIRELGYKQRESLQSFGVVDISCPIFDPQGYALAVLTSPYIRRIDRHAGPSLDEARELLIEAARSLSLNAKVEIEQPEQPE